MILIIDNYDSFTYNLYQYIGEINPDVKVIRNDMISVEQVFEMNPSHIVLSPGPGYPSSAGICIELIKRNCSIPMLGVCLGHQAIGEAFGGKIVSAPRIMHGKQDEIQIETSCKIFNNMEKNVSVGRYHSLVIDKTTLPDSLKIVATSSDGCIMGVEHKTLPIYGIQFHAESVLSPKGKTIIKNFITL